MDAFVSRAHADASGDEARDIQGLALPSDIADRAPIKPLRGSQWSMYGRAAFSYR
jgi:hypothetical protein